MNALLPMASRLAGTWILAMFVHPKKVLSDCSKQRISIEVDDLHFAAAEEGRFFDARNAL